MATYQRGKYWWYRFRFAGERIDEPTKSTSRTVAKEAERRQANAIPNAQLQANVAEAMERASRGFSKAHSLAEQIGEEVFIAVMDKLRIESLTTIPRLESLKTLVTELEEEAARSVA
jgi:hypothetical protein